MQITVGQSEDSLHKQIQDILDNWSKYTHRDSSTSSSSQTFKARPKAEPSTSTTTALTGMDNTEADTMKCVNACRCIADFEYLLKDTFRFDRETEKLICLVCEGHNERGGIFDMADVEKNKLNAKSQRLRNVQKKIISHFETNTHKSQLLQKKNDDAIARQFQERNRDVGRKLGSLAYLIFYNKLPFTLFEKLLPWMSLVNIDIGQINHSEHFVRRLLPSCYSELQQRLRRFMNVPLPCTGELRPVNITADKGTIKHDCNQVTMIRTPVLTNGTLFQRFFVGFPEVQSHKGIDVSTLILDACVGELGFTTNQLRQRISGGCFDGQYFHLNVQRHLSDMLELPVEFLEDCLIWDAAHRLELVHDDVKNGKKDQRGNVIMAPTPWLKDLDSTLQFIMTKFRTGAEHSKLRTIAHEMGETFLEFCLFSETRFMEYCHRTYDHFLGMFHVIHAKIKSDEDKAPSNTLEALEKQLLQAVTVTDMLFMKEMSHIMTLCSKSLQRFDVLPFVVINDINRLKQRLNDAKKSFELGKQPDVFVITNDYKVWDFFNISSNQICENQTFHGVQLLVPGDRGRVTRSGSQYGYEKDVFSALIKSRYPKYTKYIQDVLDSIRRRFEPWPKWLICCEEAFNFGNDLEQQERKEAFQKLMECQAGPNPLLTEEKKRLSAEYVTLCINAETVTSKLMVSSGESEKKVSQNDVWYELLTNPEMYMDCKKVNFFALKFLNRSFNEAVVEVEVSNLKQQSTESRSLLQKTTEMLNFVSTNGPHPLVSMNVVDSFLDLHFGKQWHFTVNLSKFYVSQSVDAHFRSARQLPNSLASI